MKVTNSKLDWYTTPRNHNSISHFKNEMTTLKHILVQRYIDHITAFQSIVHALLVSSFSPFTNPRCWRYQPKPEAGRTTKIPTPLSFCHSFPHSIFTLSTETINNLGKDCWRLTEPSQISCQNLTKSPQDLGIVPELF